MKKVENWAVLAQELLQYFMEMKSGKCHFDSDDCSFSLLLGDFHLVVGRRT